jgi:AbrB family looped-hinge helix DNA binding protein
MEPDFRRDADRKDGGPRYGRAFNRAPALHRFDLTVWVFLPDPSADGHYIVARQYLVDTLSRSADHLLPEVMNPDFPTPITMSTIVRVQRKGQVTIPSRLRAQVGLVDGDLVEARAHRGKIVLTPKSVVDREYTPAQRRAIDARLAEGLADIEAGRTFGPFNSADEMIARMEARRAKKPAAQRRKRSR